uniref:Uncharacterized protein n=1 Tax=Lactuca sativa TaxID=4236 RepID=A0A9R1VJW0_LACSA|nr:hypothetical protein LSAT_V11C500257640 [Lactuca sativa]
MEHVLEPNCDTSIAVKGCPDNKSEYLSAWANRRDVQKALHIREESKDAKWVACNESLKFYYDKEPISYTHNVLSNVAYHRQLASKNCRALVYRSYPPLILFHSFYLYLNIYYLSSRVNFWLTLSMHACGT